MIGFAPGVLPDLRVMRRPDIRFELRECGARFVAAGVIDGGRVADEERGRADREPYARIHGFEE